MWGSKWFRVATYSLASLLTLTLIVEKIENNKNQTAQPQQQKVNIIETLEDYKLLSQAERQSITRKLVTRHNFKISILTDYYNCMEAFSNKKDPTLSINEVIRWCSMDIPNSNRNTITYNIHMPKQYSTLKKAITSQTDFYPENNTLEFYTNTNLRLSPLYFKGDDKEIILEMAQRAFIEGVYTAFIHTNLEEIEIEIYPLLVESLNPYKTSGFNEDLRFIGKITKSQALQTAQELLKINSLDELEDNKMIDNIQFDSWSKIMNKARFNDTGYPTLNVFFARLVKSLY